MAVHSSSQKIFAQKTLCIFLVQGRDKAKQALYHYIALRASDMSKFIQANKKGGCDVSKHGVILASGWGEPDDITRQRMERDYGFHHQTMLIQPAIDPDMEETLLDIKAHEEEEENT